MSHLGENAACSGHFCGKTRSALGFRALGGAVSVPYGRSVQVKTCENPHDRTSASDSCWDLIGIVHVVVQWEVAVVL